MPNGKLRLCTLLFFALSPLRAFADPSQEYKQGVLAFKAKDYETALRHFQQAEHHGMRQSTLFYNLGSTCFKLGLYAQARTHYQRLLSDPQWGALAQYNLGLIAEREGDIAAAQRHYERALEQTQSTKLRNLIATKLTRRTETATPAWSAYVAVAAGYDDNAVLAADADAASGRSDSFYEVLGVASGYLSGNAERGTRLDLAAFTHNYHSEQEFDVSAISAALSSDRRHALWTTETALQADTVLVNDARYSSALAFKVEGRRPLRALNLALTEEFSRIDGGSAYDHLSGWRNRAGAELQVDLQQRQWRLGYELELNDRRDLDQGDEFFSYSPQRHELYVDFRYRWHPDWSTEARAAYSAARYRDDNREADDAGIAVERRSDRRLELTLRANRRLKGPLGVFAEYRYADNRSTIRRYRYDNNQMLLGLEMAL